MNRQEFLNSSVEVSAEVLSQEIDGETVLLDLKSESYFGLDEVGSRIWQLLSESSEIEYIHSTMSAEYKVDTDQLADDLRQHLGELQTAGLIKLIGSNEGQLVSKS